VPQKGAEGGDGDFKGHGNATFGDFSMVAARENVNVERVIAGIADKKNAKC